VGGEGEKRKKKKKKEKEKVKRKSQKKKSKSKEKVKVKRESQKQKVKGEKRKSKAEVKSEGQSQERWLSAVSEERSGQLAKRCQAAHPDDKSPCEGVTDAVRVKDSAGREALGCVRHGAVLLASLAGGAVYPGPGGVGGEAIEVYQRAKALKPFEFGEGRS
jgi:hypothetical protein